MMLDLRFYIKSLLRIYGAYSLIHPATAVGSPYLEKWAQVI